MSLISKQKDKLNWNLQTVIIKRKYVSSPKTAILMAYDFVPKNMRNRTKLRVTDTSFRFELLPSSMFNKWRTEKLDESVSLVYGARKKIGGK